MKDGVCVMRHCLSWALEEEASLWPCGEERWHLKAPTGSEQEHPNSCSSEKPHDKKALSHKLRCHASFQVLSKLVPQANAKWRNSHLCNNQNPVAPETRPLWCGLCSHPGFLPVKREAALVSKGTEMFVLH